MTEQVASANCRNCGTQLQGKFCHSCGQSAIMIRRSAWELLKEARDHILHWDSRLLHTLRLLFFHPGKLSLDWIEGKRVRHVPPFRLYVVASFILFLLIGIAASTATIDEAVIQVNEGAAETLNAELEQARQEGDWVSGIFLQATILAIEDPAAYMQKLLSNLPKAAFLLLPLFALLHMGVYLRQKRYYIDYLVFSLHFHAFAFLLIAMGVLIGMLSSRLASLATLLNCLIPIYGVIGFKTFNQQSWLKSLFKTIIAFGAYSLILFFLIGIYFAAVLFI